MIRKALEHSRSSLELNHTRLQNTDGQSLSLTRFQTETTQNHTPGRGGSRINLRRACTARDSNGGVAAGDVNNF